jgi:hypothetical protein
MSSYHIGPLGDVDSFLTPVIDETKADKACHKNSKNRRVMNCSRFLTKLKISDGYVVRTIILIKENTIKYHRYPKKIS